MATLGQQAAQRLRAMRRREDYRNYDDLTMLKRAMSNIPDESKELSAGLTLEKKQYDKSVRNIDNMFNQLSSRITKSDGKGMVLDENLNNDELLNLANQIKNVSKSSKSIYNPNDNFELDNYINNSANTALRTISGMIKANNLEKNIDTVEQQIKDLGDPFTKEDMFVGRGNQDIRQGYKAVLKNIKTLSDNYRTTTGDKYSQQFDKFTKDLDDKFAVFEDMQFYGSKEGQEIIKTAPKAMASYNEALRLFNTEGEENIEAIGTLLDDIVKQVGERADKNIDIDRELEVKRIKEEEKRKEDAIKLSNEEYVDTVRQGLQNIINIPKSEDVFGKDLVQSIGKLAIGDKNRYLSKPAAKSLETNLLNKLATVLSKSGVESTLDKDNQFNIEKAIKNKDLETIYDYFTDDRPYKDDSDYRIQTYGDYRLRKGVNMAYFSSIFGQKDDEIKNENISTFILNLIDVVSALRNRHGSDLKVDASSVFGKQFEADAGGASDQDGDGIPDYLDRTFQNRKVER
tara:strand:+ start:753 stop:2297 length:1545 start_codon:yes stop_codon:yes gene_type:complete